MERELVPYKVGFLKDLHQRGLLDLDPPYQRRAVWSRSFREFFVDTVLLGYPAPPIFLHEVLQDEGTPKYAVIDGKQRLLTVLTFADDGFAVGEHSPLEELRGKYFSDLDESYQKRFYGYRFICELIDTTDPSYLKEIFDRYNRNVARLTRQELRHAKFSGEFADSAEDMTRVMQEELPGLPRIAAGSARQMKDVEQTAILMLLVEKGPTSTTQDELDDIYAERDDDWPERSSVERAFRRAVSALRQLAELQNGAIGGTRLRNQGDFYGLFGAVHSLEQEGELPAPQEAVARLLDFIALVSDDAVREDNEDAERYYKAARSAANDAGQRRTRMEILTKVVRGNS